MSKTSLQPIISKLEILFSKMNEAFFCGALQPPTIAVSSKGRKKCSGWCTTQKVWSNKNCQEHEGHFEINICAEFLQTPFENISEILLHEMAHLYNIQNGVKDVSRSGTYHNKNFKKAAEEHGLIVTKDKRYGFCYTALNEEAKNFILGMEPIKIELSRELQSVQRNKSQHQGSYKYVCPQCGANIRVSKNIERICEIICKQCHIKFVEST